MTEDKLCYSMGRDVSKAGGQLLFVKQKTRRSKVQRTGTKCSYLCALWVADVVVMDRQVDRVAWKSVEGVAEGEGPLPREKHTLTALSGGRLFLFGGRRVAL